MFKRICCFLLVLSISASIYGGNLSLQRRGGDWEGVYFMAGLAGSPDYSFRSLSYVNNDGLARVNYRNNMDIPAISYTTGINAMLCIDRFSLQFSAYYSEKGGRSQKIAMTQWDMIGNTYNLGHTKWSENTEFLPLYIWYRDKVNYIDIPFSVSYRFTDSEIAPFVSLGGSYNILQNFSHDIHIYYPDNTTEVQKSKIDSGYYNTANMSYIISAGVDLRTDAKFSFRIEPIFRRTINQVTALGNIKEYFWSFGCLFGVYYRINTGRN